MTDHKGLPVKGYQSQSDDNVRVVNINKELEERVLRQIDAMYDSDAPYDHRMMAIARTGIQEAFMWLNMAVFQPGRIRLPEDKEE